MFKFGNNKQLLPNNIDIKIFIHTQQALQLNFSAPTSIEGFEYLS